MKTKHTTNDLPYAIFKYEYEVRFIVFDFLSKKEKSHIDYVCADSRDHAIERVTEMHGEVRIISVTDRTF